jgi:hypothetical protein
MASKLSIINMALLEIGEGPLTNTLDDSSAANATQAIYEDCVDETLRMHSWNCATKRATLATVSGVPLWGSGTAYQLPTDCIKVVEVAGFTAWKIEGRMLYLPSGGSPAIAYVYKMSDESLMDPLLRRAIAMRLASGVAVRLKGSQETATACFRKWQDAIAEAIHKDAVEGNIDRVWPMEFVAAHETGFMSVPGGTE